VHVRRGAPDVQDPMWNSLSKLNCIAACVAANHARADEGLMLDPNGFVATCNSVNFFIIVASGDARDTPFDPHNGGSEENVMRGGPFEEVEVWVPLGKHQLHGITRGNVMRICEQLGMNVREKEFTLTEVYSALEAFVTGTFAGVLPVVEVRSSR
jgi:branched-subunit amino acid aminotransferase/4-amino-4-deoxychorismate lyase